MAERMARGLAVVAVVGRPNVGKSSLVNRILGTREAIVEETPGVTRDRRTFVAEWAGRRFEIVDTGGLEPGAEGLEARVTEQAQVAIDTADVILLVVDASAGPMQDDVVVAERLRRAGKPVLVAANKVDDPRDEPEAAAFYKLGLGEPVAMSALHGRGSGDLLAALVELLPPHEEGETDAWGSLAIVGRPNVGKSSILNRLTRSYRSIVDAAPGTTRDPVDSFVQLDEERALRIIDTAGMRREVQIKDPIEYFGFLRSRRTLTRTDAALLIVDVSEGATGHDQRIAEEIVAHGRACVIALNKWDLVGGDENDLKRLERDVTERLRFLTWAPVVRTSAKTGRGIDKLLPALEEALRSHRRRLSTAQINRIVQDAQARRPHPRTGGRSIRILYATQAGVAPPHVILFTTGAIESGYLRFVEHAIRAVEPFRGAPVEVSYRIRCRGEVEG